MVRDYLMFTLTGACLVLMLFTFINDSISKRRKLTFFSMSFSAIMLLVSDKMAHLFDGVEGTTGFLVTRISKFLVFFLYFGIIYSFNKYLVDLFLNEGQLPDVPKRLNYAQYVIWFGIAMLTFSQFFDIYYSYDENNVYQREKGFIVSYIIPIVALLIQLTIIIQFKKRIRRRLFWPLLLFTIMPFFGSILQFLRRGVSFTSICIVGMVVLLYYFSVLDTNKLVKIAHQKEIDILKAEQRNIRLMVSQTTSALVEAIEAKDAYTNGHSQRVAKYSKMIAEKAGKTPEECEEIYLIGLLHDVGKIGVPDAIINKPGKLTAEEFETIKSHTTTGNEILSKIQISPTLSIGAHYHHEKFDGTGYPEEKKGTDIPEIARIIAVADAYDAMTSKRSYRDALNQKIVRNEIEKGAGSQFDPQFASIMLELIDADSDYQMKQT